MWAGAGSTRAQPGPVIYLHSESSGSERLGPANLCSPRTTWCRVPHSGARLVSFNNPHESLSPPSAREPASVQEQGVIKSVLKIRAWSPQKIRHTRSSITDTASAPLPEENPVSCSSLPSSWTTSPSLHQHVTQVNITKRVRNTFLTLRLNNGHPHEWDYFMTIRGGANPNCSAFPSCDLDTVSCHLRIFFFFPPSSTQMDRHRRSSDVYRPNRPESCTPTQMHPCVEEELLNHTGKSRRKTFGFSVSVKNLFILLPPLGSYFSV